MSNHVHLICSAIEGYQLSDIVRDFKRHTATSILKHLLEGQGESRSEWMLRLFKYFAKYNKNNSRFQFWKRENKPIALNSPKWINQNLAYIHTNPVRAGLVDKAEHYIYSSANYYINETGKIEIDMLDYNITEGYIDN